MKRSLLLFLLLGLSAATAGADAPARSKIAPRLQKIFIWAAGKDAANVATVELDVSEMLAKHGIPGERFSKVFPQGLPAAPADGIAAMRATGCDALLVLRRVAAIRWESDNPRSSLISFLTHSPQLIDPKNQLEAQSAVPIEVVNTFGNAGWEINKGEALVFDLVSEKLIWRGDTQVKTAKDLPQARYYQLVAEKVTSLLASAELIPPIKK